MEGHTPPGRTGEALEERAFTFACQQYRLLAERAVLLQGEREIWIRHSILATFAFFGWIAVYRDSLAETFMLRMVEVEAIYFVPFVFNCGGALRFFFIQRDINRLFDFLAEMERGMLALPEHLCESMSGRGLRDRHWHWPSILYWVAIVGLSAGVAMILAFL